MELLLIIINNSTPWPQNFNSKILFIGLGNGKRSEYLKWGEKILFKKHFLSHFTRTKLFVIGNISFRLPDRIPKLCRPRWRTSFQIPCQNSELIITFQKIINNTISFYDLINQRNSSHAPFSRSPLAQCNYSSILTFHISILTVIFYGTREHCTCTNLGVFQSHSKRIISWNTHSEK